MRSTHGLSRRGVVAGCAAALGAWLLAPMQRLHAACAGPTPRQTAGPFYPQGSIPERWDLLASTQEPTGEAIHVEGVVTDAGCQPLPGARVELWQADPNGRYNHGRSVRSELLPGFRYYGAVRTGADGTYRFRTLRPGAYGSGGFRRTPHIHFRVLGPDGAELITQMYFADAPTNARDGLLQRIPEAERPRVVVPLEPGSEAEAARTARFDIVLA